MITGLFYTYRRIHFIGGNASCFWSYVISNDPGEPHVAAAPWPCSYLFLVSYLVLIRAWIKYNHIFTFSFTIWSDACLCKCQRWNMCHALTQCASPKVDMCRVVLHLLNEQQNSNTPVQLVHGHLRTDPPRVYTTITLLNTNTKNGIGLRLLCRFFVIEIWKTVSFLSFGFTKNAREDVDCQSKYFTF